MGAKIGRFLKRYVLSLLGCVYLHTLGIGFRKHRELIHRICLHFGFESSAQEEPQISVPLIPTTTIESVIPGRTDITILHPVSADGNISCEELVILSTIVRHFSPAACFEIGTFNGRTTMNIVANSGAENQVYTLDLPPVSQADPALSVDGNDEKFIGRVPSGELFRDTQYASQITQLWGDSATFDFTPYYDKIDLVFIDGAHSYEYVKHDSLTALRLLRDGKGIILWHDYNSVYWPGLTKALNELYLQDPRFKAIRYIEGTALSILRVS